MSTPQEDVYRVTFNGRAGYGDALRLTLHYRLTVAGALLPFADLLDAMAAGPATIFMQGVSNTAVMDKITIRSYTTPVVGADKAVSIQGTQSGDPLPQQICAQVIWYTGFIGPRYRGRNHFWYGNEAALTAGVFTPTAVGIYETIADSLLVVYDIATGLIPYMVLVILSKELTQAEDVTSRVVTADPRNQLSRTIGRGA